MRADPGPDPGTAGGPLGRGWHRDLPAGIALALLVALLAGAACTVRPKPAALAPRDDAGPPVTYVAVGDSETVGFGTPQPLRDAFPQQLYRRALPRRTVFVNLGISGATVSQAAAEEAAQAVALVPTLVTVWLNVNDLNQRHPADRYEQELGQLVHQLRRGGATEVLLANAPPLRGLLGSTTEAAVDAYNAATARVAEREGAVLVDLHAAYRSASTQGRQADFDGPDGFHPTAAGHKAVADAFARALEAAGGVR